MVVLGLDPGLSNTGYGVIRVQGGRVFHIAHGSVTTDSGSPHGDRLAEIFQRIDEIVATYSPDIAGIEGIYFSRNRNTAIPVAEARGVLLLLLHKRGIPTFNYPPLQIKRALTGVGSSDKHQVQEMVRFILGLEEPPVPDHASDALGVAICCFHHQQGVVMMGGSNVE